eukprot:TRINITY_DN2240_c1_g3_i1.p1 TRINITY_DN2240_c1_g3~~TRINITY_DN2240_c1_g3_i1.p1  ORF type:complete len:117 (+),score=38.51 TRINITY_DN2240_c1_g3_i1:48-398(+)
MANKKALANPTYKKLPLKNFKNFEEFYPFYLGEHANQINRRLHIIGTTSAFLFIIYMFLTFKFQFFFVIFLIGYGFAWIGHFFFEKNKPATFKYPRWSLQGDFQMWKEVISGSRDF